VYERSGMLDGLDTKPLSFILIRNPLQTDVSFRMRFPV